MSERDIFVAAKGKPDSASRTAFLVEACAGDRSIRHRVERLLQADGEPGGLIDRPAVASLAITQTVLNSLDSSVTVNRNSRPTADSELRPFLSPSDRSDSLGRIGHYEVLEIVGTGAFGIVLRAMDVTLHRIVAVKVLAPQLAASESSRQRFLREARSAAAIRHENVVQVYAVEEQPLPYLVMEFLPGETLQQRLDRIGRLPVTEVVEIGWQIANGLAAAHAMGLIHRDVKPANVFLEQSDTSERRSLKVDESRSDSNSSHGVTHRRSSQSAIVAEAEKPSVKLLDFGLARAVDDVSLTQSGMIIGTPLYMSPEQARSEPLDHRADLFSLGSVLYAITTGQSPFRADNTLATLKRVAEETPQPIDELAPETPRWLCDLIMKLLAKNPNQRVQTAREVSALLLASDQLIDRPISRNALASGSRGDGHSEPDASAFRLMRHTRQRLFVTTLAAVLVLGAILFSFKTRNGEVLVELPDDVSAEIAKELTIKMSGKHGVKVVNKASGWTIGTQEGEYDVQLSGGNDRIQIKDNQVTVTRDKRAIVKVIWKPNAVARSGDQPQPPNVAAGLPTVPPVDPDRRAVEWLRKRLPTFPIMVHESKHLREIAADQPLPANPFQLYSVGFRGDAADRLGDGLAEELADGLRGTRLAHVYFNCNSISNEGLVKVLRLPGFSELTAMNLNGDKFDDGLFAELAEFSTLTNLDIASCPRITGKGLSALRTLPRFWILTIIACPVSPEGLSELRQLPHLRYLNISASPLTAAHVTELVQTRLQELIAGGTQLDNEQAARLAQMRTLHRLNLVGNKQITDELLTTLPQCDWLKKIELSLPGVSAAGVEKLKRAMPKCEVIWTE